MVCHPSRTFSPKNLEREPQNRLSPSPDHQTISSFTSDPWSTTLVLAGYKWVVPESCACSTSMCVHGLSAVHAFAMTWGLAWPLLHVLLLILDLLQRKWVTGLSSFISCFLPGLGLAWAWSFPSSIQPLSSSWVGWHFCHAAPLFLACYYLTCACWASFVLVLHFILNGTSSQILYITFGLLYTSSITTYHVFILTLKF